MSSLADHAREASGDHLLRLVYDVLKKLLTSRNIVDQSHHLPRTPHALVDVS
jgi:hypothetical protein